ncbi:Fgr16 protein [Candida orthopsilosis Co 90-125]|uniref:Pre-mRNA-splicing factor 38 n=1 Tax=Candida orthopsilosis (strain 90-125) TaxID=1136231 RepID=H8WYB4_CANO9|nr:Fgr16 protein [Candida orthopsilosis Co 90-125]CCG21229.1 Fgr16 protein [Candida orthopsilosis Co 90-125]
MTTNESSVYYKKQAKYHDKRNILNKSYLVEPIIRHRIHDSIFYKEHLYLTNESTILPIITQHVHYISGVDSVGRPSPFLQCLLRLLELEPSKEIINVYLDQLSYSEFKYLTALALLYVRLVFPSEEVYNIFDQHAQDYRKLRVKLKTPQFDAMQRPIHYKLGYMDEFIDGLLTQERVVDLILPRLIPRLSLVERGLVAPRQYFIGDEMQKGVTNVSQNQDKTIHSDGESSYQSDSD